MNYLANIKQNFSQLANSTKLDRNNEPVSAGGGRLATDHVAPEIVKAFSRFARFETGHCLQQADLTKYLANTKQNFSKLANSTKLDRNSEPMRAGGGCLATDHVAPELVKAFRRFACEDTPSMSLRGGSLLGNSRKGPQHQPLETTGPMCYHSFDAEDAMTKVEPRQSVGGNPIHSRPPTAARAPPDNALKAPQDLPKGFLQVAAPPTPGVSAPLAPASPLVAVSETTAVPGKCSESQYRSLHDACTQPAALVSSACQIEITAAHSAQASSTLTAQQLNSCGSPECSELQHNSVSLQLVDQSSISQPCGGTLSSEQSGSALQAHSCVTSTSEQSAYQHQTADAFLHRNPATSAQGNHVHSGEIPTDPASSAFPSPVSALVDTGLCGLHQPRPGHGTDELASISYYKTRVDEQAIPPSHGTLLKHASPEAASETSSASTCHNCMDSGAPASMNHGSFSLDSGAAPLSLQKLGGLLENHAMPASALTSSHAAEDSMSSSTVQVKPQVSKQATAHQRLQSGETRVWTRPSSAARPANSVKEVEKAAGILKDIPAHSLAARHLQRIKMSNKVNARAAAATQDSTRSQAGSIAMKAKSPIFSATRSATFQSSSDDGRDPEALARWVEGPPAKLKSQKRKLGTTSQLSQVHKDAAFADENAEQVEDDEPATQVSDEQMALQCHNLRSQSVKQAKKIKYAPDMAYYHGEKAWENYQTWDDDKDGEAFKKGKAFVEGYLENMDVRLAKKYVMFTPRGGNQPWRIDLHASQEMWDKKLHVSGMGAAAARAFLIITRTFFMHQLSGGKVWVITGKGEQSGGVQFDEVGKMLEGLCTDKLVEYYQEKNKKGAYLVVLAKPIAA